MERAAFRVQIDEIVGQESVGGGVAVGYDESVNGFSEKQVFSGNGSADEGKPW